MDCSRVRDSILAYHSGDLPNAEAEAVGSHLATCDACTAEARSLLSPLSLLKSIPEITPAEDVWNRLSEAIDRDLEAVRPAKATPFRAWVKLAAAASILAAALSFLYVGVVTRNVPVATVAVVLPGAESIVGKSFSAGETFVAPTYAVLTLPGVGTLKLDKGTAVRFEGPRRVRLESGDLFAEVIPNGRGFVVASRDASVTVHGTRFGVKAGATPSTVYVLEGRVSVDSNAGSLLLTERQMATVGGPAKALEDEALRWIATNEIPTVVMRVDRSERSMRRGDALRFTLSLRSTSPAPVLLETLRDLPGHLAVKVTDPAGKEYLANLEGRDVSPLNARQAPNGLVRVDVASPCVLSCSLGLKDGFERTGTYRIALSYDGSRTPGGSGTVIPSDPFTIEVRD